MIIDRELSPAEIPNMRLVWYERHALAMSDIPQPWEDLESRAPIVAPYTTIVQFLVAPEGDLLSRP